MAPGGIADSNQLGESMLYEMRTIVQVSYCVEEPKLVYKVVVITELLLLGKS